MDRAVIMDEEGSLGRKVAEQLADVLNVPCHRSGDAGSGLTGVYLVRTAESCPEGVPLAVYIDDRPVKQGGRSVEREAALRALARTQRAGGAAIVLTDASAAKRWISRLKDEGILQSHAIRRLFLAAGPSPECEHLLGQLSAALDLPAGRPDDEGDLSREGWGRHYAAAAAGDRWLMQSASWHAVEYLAARADAVIHLPAKEGPVARPDQRKWRTIFGAWFKRYPAIEARLLSRNVAAFSHLAPVYVLRNRHELEAVTAGLTNPTVAMSSQQTPVTG